MARGVRPTRKEKQLLSARGKQPGNWLKISESGKILIFRHKHSGSTIRIET